MKGKREYGKDGNNGTDGKNRKIFRLFRYFRLFRILFSLSERRPKLNRDLPMEKRYGFYFFA